jgi:hypothetical protein
MNDLPEKKACSERPRGSAALRFLPALLIVAGALAWYGSYWRYWFNPHDEGGTVCMVAQRLLAGERPWVDVDPGYNIGWFYPVVWLFHFTGVNYLAARAWFFALATCTALLGCGIVTRISGSRWLGLAVGWILVALPGSQFKDYIPLAEAANTACLILMTRTNPASAGRWVSSVILGGLTLGLTFLVRVELGYFFLFIWIGVLLFLLLDRRASLKRQALCAVAGFVCLAAGILIPVTPAYFFCRSQGIETQFLNVYVNWARFLEHSIETGDRRPHRQAQGLEPAETAETGELKGIPSGPPSPGPAPTTASTPASAPAPTPGPTPAPPPAPAVASASAAPDSVTAQEAVESSDSSTLHREPLSGVWRAKGRNRLLPFLTYAPIFSFAIFLLLAMAGVARELWRGDFTLAAAPMQWLLLIGGSLTTFPQFFFFRPDRPHLSEFMPGFIIAMAGGLCLLWPRQGTPGFLRRAGVWIYSGVLAVHLAAFAFFAFEHPSAGTIAARKGRKIRFDAENGVRVFASKREAQILAGVRDSVLRHSQPGDYLVCFPYMPGYNLMTNRRTYIRNVYVDNATHNNHWSEAAIEAFETKRPAVVIIDDRKINGMDASRFSRWAAKAYAYLKQNYARVDRFDNNQIEVFALPSALPPDQSSPP